ncbi:uncharacterized protein PFL1_04931 [Pseudozyma flocculosa PF-1]|uniref:Uncharacterized protein n=1 Tax=Pseudozyma flocculosa PF-1 TaxID=1277687 RepID=A0A061H3J4_9BASI|nr:uncharacterized protein PFL1_04931 [Pseudozyma flocculosa PF-1]EPQ27392.1 hypothetical protein PFL1_04931 [Pseudozyma flocculosa PF-1]
MPRVRSSTPTASEAAAAATSCSHAVDRLPDPHAPVSTAPPSSSSHRHTSRRHHPHHYHGHGYGRHHQPDRLSQHRHPHAQHGHDHRAHHRACDDAQVEAFSFAATPPPPQPPSPRAASTPPPPLPPASPLPASPAAASSGARQQRSRTLSHSLRRPRADLFAGLRKRGATLQLGSPSTTPARTDSCSSDASTFDDASSVVRRPPSSAHTTPPPLAAPPVPQQHCGLSLLKSRTSLSRLRGLANSPSPQSASSVGQPTPRNSNAGPSSESPRPLSSRRTRSLSSRQHANDSIEQPSRSTSQRVNRPRAATSASRSVGRSLFDCGSIGDSPRSPHPIQDAAATRASRVRPSLPAEFDAAAGTSAAPSSQTYSSQGAGHLWHDEEARLQSPLWSEKALAGLGFTTPALSGFLVRERAPAAPSSPPAPASSLPGSPQPAWAPMRPSSDWPSYARERSSGHVDGGTRRSMARDAGEDLVYPAHVQRTASRASYLPMPDALEARRANSPSFIDGPASSLAAPESSWRPNGQDAYWQRPHIGIGLPTAYHHERPSPRFDGHPEAFKLPRIMTSDVRSSVDAPTVPRAVQHRLADQHAQRPQTNAYPSGPAAGASPALDTRRPAPDSTNPQRQHPYHQQLKHLSQHRQQQRRHPSDLSLFTSTSTDGPGTASPGPVLTADTSMTSLGPSRTGHDSASDDHSRAKRDRRGSDHSVSRLPTRRGSIDLAPAHGASRPPLLSPIASSSLGERSTHSRSTPNLVHVQPEQTSRLLEQMRIDELRAHSVLQSGYLEPSNGCEAVFLPRPRLRAQSVDDLAQDFELGRGRAARQRQRQREQPRSGRPTAGYQSDQEELAPPRWPDQGRAASPRMRRQPRGTPYGHDDALAEPPMSAPIPGARPIAVPHRDSSMRTDHARSNSNFGYMEEELLGHETEALDLRTVLRQGSQLEAERAAWRHEHQRSMNSLTASIFSRRSDRSLRSSSRPTHAASSSKGSTGDMALEGTAPAPGRSDLRSMFDDPADKGKQPERPGDEAGRRIVWTDKRTGRSFLVMDDDDAFGRTTARPSSRSDVDVRASRDRHSASRLSINPSSGMTFCQPLALCRAAPAASKKSSSSLLPPPSGEGEHDEKTASSPQPATLGQRLRARSLNFRSTKSATRPARPSAIERPISRADTLASQFRRPSGTLERSLVSDEPVVIGKFTFPAPPERTDSTRDGARQEKARQVGQSRHHGSFLELAHLSGEAEKLSDPGDDAHKGDPSQVGLALSTHSDNTSLWGSHSDIEALVSSVWASDEQAPHTLPSGRYPTRGYHRPTNSGEIRAQLSHSRLASSSQAASQAQVAPPTSRFDVSGSTSVRRKSAEAGVVAAPPAPPPRVPLPPPPSFPVSSVPVPVEVTGSEVPEGRIHLPPQGSGEFDRSVHLRTGSMGSYADRSSLPVPPRKARSSTLLAANARSGEADTSNAGSGGPFRTPRLEASTGGSSSFAFSPEVLHLTPPRPTPPRRGPHEWSFDMPRNRREDAEGGHHDGHGDGHLDGDGDGEDDEDDGEDDDDDDDGPGRPLRAWRSRGSIDSLGRRRSTRRSGDGDGDGARSYLTEAHSRTSSIDGQPVLWDANEASIENLFFRPPASGPTWI